LDDVKSSTASLVVDLQKCDRLHSGYVKTLAATDIFAGRKIVCTHHLRLRLGESGPVTLIRATPKLGLFPADEPPELVLVRLAAVRAR
jgi:hypothetical protein